jgi:hypothetical protein
MGSRRQRNKQNKRPDDDKIKATNGFHNDDLHQPSAMLYFSPGTAEGISHAQTDLLFCRSKTKINVSYKCLLSSSNPQSTERSSDFLRSTMSAPFFFAGCSIWRKVTKGSPGEQAQKVSPFIVAIQIYIHGTVHLPKLANCPPKSKD